MIATVSDLASAHGTRRRSITKARIQKLYDASASFTDLLPWAEFLPEPEVTQPWRTARIKA
jgi:hypothetical protein